MHDGFISLVNCLDQLELRVLYEQKTQSPLMGTRPTDQPFRYDGPVANYGRESGFLVHSSIHSFPIPKIADLQSLRWRPVSNVICVCSFYAAHVGIAVDRVWSSGTRWQVLCIVSHTPIQGCRRFSLVTPMCGFLLSNLVGRDKLIPCYTLWFSGTLSTFQLVVRRWTSSLQRVLSHATSHCGFTCCSVACCPLLASNLCLCSCRINLPQCVPANPSNTSTMPRVRDYSSVVASCVFNSLTQILFDGAFFHSRQRPATSPPCFHNRQPLWWNDTCFCALVARNGSCRDFRRSSSARGALSFPLSTPAIQQHCAFFQGPLLEWMAWQCAVSLPQKSQTGVLPHSTHLPHPHNPTQMNCCGVRSFFFCPLPSRCKNPLVCPRCFLPCEELSVLR